MKVGTHFYKSFKRKKWVYKSIKFKKKYLSGFLETNLFQGQVDTNNDDEDQVFAGNLYLMGT